MDAATSARPAGTDPARIVSSSLALPRAGRDPAALPFAQALGGDPFEDVEFLCRMRSTRGARSAVTRAGWRNDLHRGRPRSRLPSAHTPRAPTVQAATTNSPHPMPRPPVVPVSQVPVSRIPSSWTSGSSAPRCPRRCGRVGHPGGETIVEQVAGPGLPSLHGGQRPVAPRSSPLERIQPERSPVRPPAAADQARHPRRSQLPVGLSSCTNATGPADAPPRSCGRPRADDGWRPGSAQCRRQGCRVQYPASSGERRMGLQLLCPLPELHLGSAHAVRRFRCAEQLGREGHGIGYSCSRAIWRHTDAEDAEAVQQGQYARRREPANGLFRGRIGRRTALRAADRRRMPRQVRSGELTLAQSPGGHREQPGDGDDGLAQVPMPTIRRHRAAIPGPRASSIRPTPIRPDSERTPTTPERATRPPTCRLSSPASNSPRRWTCASGTPPRRRPTSRPRGRATAACAGRSRRSARWCWGCR